MSDKRCLNCGQPVWLVPLLGWVHVSVFDNLDCEVKGMSDNTELIKDLRWRDSLTPHKGVFGIAADALEAAERELNGTRRWGQANYKERSK